MGGRGCQGTGGASSAGGGRFAPGFGLYTRPAALKRTVSRTAAQLSLEGGRASYFPFPLGVGGFLGESPPFPGGFGKGRGVSPGRGRARPFNARSTSARARASRCVSSEISARMRVLAWSLLAQLSTAAADAVALVQSRRSHASATTSPHARIPRTHSASGSYTLPPSSPWRGSTPPYRIHVPLSRGYPTRVPWLPYHGRVSPPTSPSSSVYVK